jgi:molybdopterin molybdotransferase
MLTYDQALTQILSKVQPRTPVETALSEALGQVLAEEVVSPLALPPFANSAMDGYAVRAADVQDATPKHPVTLPVTGEVAAGATDCPEFTPGAALRIMTGAPLPDGADAVVPVEDTEIRGEKVRIRLAVAPGRFVRAAGEDVQAGETVINTDTLLRPAEIGMAAAVGRTSLLTYPRPRVAILSTGDELMEPGQALPPGHIYNSNAYALAAQVAEAGGSVDQQIHAGDSPGALRQALDACRGTADVILSSGGVSVGAYDFVKDILGERGLVDFWRVAIRPGKPVVFGECEGALFFGLPGNPVSSQVTFELFVRPALRQLRGLSEALRPTVQARLTTDAEHEPGRRSFQRAFLTQEGDARFVHPVGGQGSHQMRALVLANALLILPEHMSRIAAGEFATVMPLD